ncbi:hypothetical protein [Microbacterium luticocti]|uniref:hypothetical protein n=1 Tax=Microbacterium luticocti TaxID=451764 RepID=UPI00042654CF|nr:hypothetical protein [Microbacterium luticocti]
MEPREKHRRTHRRPAPAQATPVRTARWPVGCWIFILAAIGIVQIVRLQWFDAAVYAAAAVGVWLLARGVLPAPPRWRVALPWLAGAAAVAGAVLCFLPRHSPLMQVLVIVIGMPAVALAWSGAALAHPRHPTSFGPGIRRLALAWAVILVAGCIWELVQFILGLVHPDATSFALSDLLNPAVATVPGQIAFIAVWLAGGVWLLRRGGAR